MLTRADAESDIDKTSVPTVMVGELWRSRADGDLILFVEQAPFPRSAEELQDDW